MFESFLYPTETYFSSLIFFNNTEHFNILQFTPQYLILNDLISDTFLYQFYCNLANLDSLSFFVNFCDFNKLNGFASITGQAISNFAITLDYSVFWGIERIQTAELQPNTFFLNYLNSVQIDKIDYFNYAATYHYSIPVVKLYYPEPYIASASFMHTDLWFVHILIYQYWLWFVFIFLIVFFLITFMAVIRWCNPRIKPRRETRNISRSKCGDLITACVPVSWAASIIITESTDAIDYYDGFGTSELVIGIRAYQWGWEYYYPKDVDLNYRLTANYTTFIGNSLSYHTTSAQTLKLNKMWQYHQKQLINETSIPPYTPLTLQSDPTISNCAQSTFAGKSPLKEINSFKAIQKFSKTSYAALTQLPLTPQSRYCQLQQQLQPTFQAASEYAFNLKRQWNFMPNATPLQNCLTFFDYRNFSQHATAYHNTPLTSVNGLWLTNRPLFSQLTQLPNMWNLTYILQTPLSNFTWLFTNLNLFADSKSYFLNSQNTTISPTPTTNLLTDTILFQTRFTKILQPYAVNQAIFLENHLVPTWKVANIGFFATLALVPVTISRIILPANAYYSFFKQNINDFSAIMPLTTRIADVTIFFNSLHKSSYFPLLARYFDYDFRNTQMLEFRESNYWEAFFPTSSYTEYLALQLDKNLILLVDNLQYYKNLIAFKQILSLYPTALFFEKSLPLMQITDVNFLKLEALSTALSIHLDKTLEFWKFTTLVLTASHWNLLLGRTTLLAPQLLLQKINEFQLLSPELLWYADTISTVQLNTAYPLYNALTSRHLTQFNYITATRALLTTQNAMQKIFHARFDENRSHTKLNDLSNCEKKQPLITTFISYKQLLKKNSTTYVNTNWYKTQFAFYDYASLLLLPQLNTYCFDFPLLLAVKSDVARMLWLDWYSKWNFIIVQPASPARYALYGMPYLSKLFEFGTSVDTNYNEAENYFTRLTSIRGNFLSAWTTIPFFFATMQSDSIANMYTQLLTLPAKSLTRSYFWFTYLTWYWESSFNVATPNFIFSPNHSYQTSYGKGYSESTQLVTAHWTTFAVLLELLTKREYLYRQTCFLNNKLINLPLHLTSSPQHPLITELLPFTILNTLLETTTPVTLNLTKQLFNSFKITTLVPQTTLFRDQYRPLRKGISNMIRIHATEAIALPIEIRIQLLASSKDVIHSWAIPSAGIKLDCIPGYSSHKITIFLVSGIFWGQCMEICGRYHHWMPIVLFFMKRDLFFLWCTHFVFTESTNSPVTAIDRWYQNTANTVSFDKLTWLLELNKL